MALSLMTLMWHGAPGVASVRPPEHVQHGVGRREQHDTSTRMRSQPIATRAHDNVGRRQPRLQRHTAGPVVHAAHRPTALTDRPSAPVQGLPEAHASLHLPALPGAARASHRDAGEQSQPAVVSPKMRGQRGDTDGLVGPRQDALLQGGAPSPKQQTSPKQSPKLRAVDSGSYAIVSPRQQHKRLDRSLNLRGKSHGNRTSFGPDASPRSLPRSLTSVRLELAPGVQPAQRSPRRLQRHVTVSCIDNASKAPQDTLPVRPTGFVAIRPPPVQVKRMQKHKPWAPVDGRSLSVVHPPDESPNLSGLVAAIKATECDPGCIVASAERLWPGDTILVKWSMMDIDEGDPGQRNDDYIGIYEDRVCTSEPGMYEASLFTMGQRLGMLSFSAPNTPGLYSVRYVNEKLGHVTAAWEFQVLQRYDEEVSPHHSNWLGSSSYYAELTAGKTPPRLEL